MIHVQVRRPASIGACSSCARPAIRRVGDGSLASGANPLLFLGGMFALGIAAVVVVEWTQGGMRRRR